MKARDITLILVVVVLVLVAFAFNGPMPALARGVGADALAAPLAAPFGTAFTYQGQLMDGGEPADGAYDFIFALYDSPLGGLPLVSDVIVEDVVVTGGLFSTELDFDVLVFNGGERWLEIRVRPGASTGAYTTLAPRQAINPTPYAIYAADADTLDGQHASEFANTPAPKVRATYSSAGPDLPSGTYVLLAFDVEDYDVGSMHDTATNPSRFTAPESGVYRMSAIISYWPTANGTRHVHLVLNGGTDIAWVTIPGAGTVHSTDVVVTTSYELDAGDYIEAYAYQDSGSIITLNPPGHPRSQFTMEYVP